MNNMDESMDAVEQSLAGARTGVDRRTMLKAAVAAGTIAGTWVAPRIQTLGFAPAGAATQCIIMNPAGADLQSNQNDNTYVSATYTRCPGNQSMSYGSSANAVDTISIVNPVPGCTFTVRLVPADCNNTHTNRFNPDFTGFAVVVAPATAADPDCAACTLVEVVIFEQDRTTIVETFNNIDDPFAQTCGNGILVELPCDIEEGNVETRLAIRISCDVVGPCTP